MIRITVTGINEIVSLLNRNVNDMPTLQKEVLDEIATQFATEMQKNVHVISGNLKNSIYKNPAQNDYVEVGASADYAIYENRRTGSRMGFRLKGQSYGTHDFATKAFNTVKANSWNIVVMAYRRLFNG